MVKNDKKFELKNWSFWRIFGVLGEFLEWFGVFLERNEAVEIY